MTQTVSTSQIVECLGTLIIASALTAGCGSPPPPAADAELALPPTPAEFVAGEKRYEENCAVCHDSSRDGSPRLGYLRAWASRLEQGESVLAQHAIEGIGMMAPRGENPELTDQEITEVVRYMIYRAELDIPARH